MTAAPRGSSAWWERRALHEKATGPPAVSGWGWAPGSKLVGNLVSPCGFHGISFSGRIPVGYAVSSRLWQFLKPQATTFTESGEMWGGGIILCLESLIQQTCITQGVGVRGGDHDAFVP